jgi:uncharacterized damage-inducible protein DinB
LRAVKQNDRREVTVWPGLRFFTKEASANKKGAARLLAMIEAALSMAKVQFAHNRWANDTLLESLKAMPAEQYTAAPCSGNGSIGATVAHLLLVQESWISFLSGSATLEQAIALVRATGDLPTADTALARWHTIDEQTNAYLDSLTDEAFVTERSFTLPGGFSSSLPIWQMLLQLSSHGVHTRGQIVSAVRSTGAKPAEVSFFGFCMKTRAESAVLVEDEADA